VRVNRATGSIFHAKRLGGHLYARGRNDPRTVAVSTLGSWQPGSGSRPAPSPFPARATTRPTTRPEPAEAGSPNVIGAVALRAAIGILEDIG
jgi:selenocysteine lyase/cysteine desulfurase